MASRRSYGSYNDGCAAAHALDLIGERWTMIIVRELLLGPKRFTDIQRDVIGIGPTVLTQRLHDLEGHGIVRRRQLPAPARADVYELTEWGSGLESVNTALSLWAVESPALPIEADMSPDTVVLAMRAHARASSGAREGQRVLLSLTDSRLGDSEPVTYLAAVTEEATTIRRTLMPESADAEVSATTKDWKACVIGGAALEELPEIRVVGSAEAVRLLISATSLGGGTRAAG
ncbi:winged helix-turn-helix transcriptional regulator [Brevibacterium daeguense]|uniref:Winged helix-turn-helix transcriptional regulator n=1 Tax=Brevibacterium daeguense TaxID=909936 RepID=A0ABP8EIB4_9MICO|nr:helix-turn-helix domain-containing protein [Brevibacterium daeguense]